VNVLYTGYVGGSPHHLVGGAANYVCLPSDPVWGKYQDALNSLVGMMYGTEFQTNEQRTGGDQFFFGEALYDEDALCAVCRSTTRGTTVMIPGRNVCYDGWHAEYSGFLMSGASINGRGASEFVCVDARPDQEPHSRQNDDGKLFYFV
jgi:hypothetical protein